MISAAIVSSIVSSITAEHTYLNSLDDSAREKYVEEQKRQRDIKKLTVEKESSSNWLWAFFIGLLVGKD